MEIRPQSHVGEIVAHHPSTSRVFERYGIDFCCGGKRTLDEVCATRGLDAGELARALELELAHDPEEGDSSLLDESLAAIARYIVERYHVPLREELARLGRLGEHVARAHGDEHPELAAILETFRRLRPELEMHMEKEEALLFPLMESLERGRLEDGIERVLGPIGAMEAEHQEAGAALERMRSFSGGYRPPAGACNTFLAFYDGLAHFEQEMHRHVHLENEVLFPRAGELAERLGAVRRNA